MQRTEIFLVSILVAILLAGMAYETYRGADKTAEVIITHPGTTPFDAQGTPTPLPVSRITPIPATATTAPPQPTNPDPLLAFINHATEVELQTLSGIGPVLAQRIILDRQRSGLYASLEDLLRVTGIGDAKLRAMIDAFAATSHSPSPTPYNPVQNRMLPINPLFQRTPTPWRRVPISLNQATREDLLALPGFGEMLVESLLLTRAQQGGFRTWDDVGKVSGIGDKRLQELQQRFFLPPPRK